MVGRYIKNYKKTKVGFIPNSWCCTKLKEVSKLTAGGTPSKGCAEYWNGDIPWMSSGELNYKRVYDVKGRITKLGLKNSSAKFIPKHSVLIGLAGQGKTRGTVATNEIELCTNQSVAAIIPDPAKVYYAYAFYNLEHRYLELRRLSTGDGGRGGLNLKLLGNLFIALPVLQEQKKIAKIISTWDKSIDQLDELIKSKEKQKKALMQQIFNGKISFERSGKTIRHKGLRPDGWKKIKMNQAFERVQRTTTSDVTDVLSITAKVGFVNQKDKFSKVIAGQNLQKYILLRKGEFAYNKGNSKAYPQGCIYKLVDYERAVVPNVYFCFRPRMKGFHGDFYKYYFENGMLNHQLHRVINTGVRNDGLLNIYPKSFFNLDILVPPIKEQEHIAMLFACTDKEIKLLKRKLILFEKQKNGLMQKLLTGKVRVKV